MPVATTSAESPVARLANLGRRALKVVTSAEHRRLRRLRSLTQELKALSPQLRFLGMEDEGGVTFVHLDDAIISVWVIGTGHFQRDDLHTIWRLAQQEAPRPSGGVFVDVGSNVGTTTLYAMRTGDFGRAVSLEPAPDNLDVLRLNVLANGLEDRVHVVPAACGGEPGTIQLWLSSVTQGDHRVGRGASAPPPDHGRPVEVPLVTLDGALRDAGVAPNEVSLVWVDTQGHEPHVLRGAAQVLAGGAPFAIEFWPQQYEADGVLEEMLTTIVGSFERYIDIHGVDLVPRPTNELRELARRLIKVGGQTDLLLLPPQA